MGSIHCLFQTIPVCCENSLARNMSPDQLYLELMNHDHSGEARFARLSKEETTKILAEVRVDERLSLMRLSTRLLLAATIKQVTKHKTCRADHIEIPQEQVKWDDSNSFVHPTLDIRLPNHDEQPSSQGSNITGTSEGEKTFLRIFNSIPIIDALHPDLQFDSVLDGIAYGQKVIGKILPRPRYAWVDLDLDKTQAYIAYYGIGQLYISCSDKPDLGEHMVDLRFMRELAVREAFERYGACAYFQGQKLTKIFWCHGDKLVGPDDADWEHVKYAWRVALFTAVTAVDHLLKCHLIVSNAVNAAARESLPPDHCIRRVLHANFFGTARVNAAAINTLSVEGCFFHRASSFEWEGGLRAALHTFADSHEFETFPQRVEKSSLPEAAKKELPYFVDGLDVWAALHDFYEAYVELYYPDDASVQADDALVDYWQFRSTPMYSNKLPPLSKSALVEQLTHTCFYVSAQHQITGDVVQYLTTPIGMFWQSREGQTSADAEEFTIVMTLMATTGREMPRLMEDWSHLIDAKANEPWQKLQSDLAKVSEAVKERNLTRPIPFTEMDPQHFECSVSI
mmetsp:Transcript_76483/g.177487  ORF Transcript_76483/g.177487 Transcript_76483/m.177487 type:complete len:568 (-) Transcript_76483:275-1978(-)